MCVSHHAAYVWDPDEVDFATCSAAPLCVLLLCYKLSPHSNQRINDLFFSGFWATAQTDPHPSGLFTHVWYISVWSDATWGSIKTCVFLGHVGYYHCQVFKAWFKLEIYYRNIKSPLWPMDLVSWPLMFGWVWFTPLLPPVSQVRQRVGTLGRDLRLCGAAHPPVRQVSGAATPEGKKKAVRDNQEVGVKPLLASELRGWGGKSLCDTPKSRQTESIRLE